MRVAHLSCITIPEINRWKSHPFSVSYKNGEKELVFHVKTWGVKGSFTERLRKLASKSDAVELNPLLQGRPQASQMPPGHERQRH